MSKIKLNLANVVARRFYAFLQGPPSPIPETAGSVGPRKVRREHEVDLPSGTPVEPPPAYMPPRECTTTDSSTSKEISTVVHIQFDEEAGFHHHSSPSQVGQTKPAAGTQARYFTICGRKLKKPLPRTQFILLLLLVILLIVGTWEGTRRSRTWAERNSETGETGLSAGTSTTMTGTGTGTGTGPESTEYVLEEPHKYNW